MCHCRTVRAHFTHSFVVIPRARCKRNTKAIKYKVECEVKVRSLNLERVQTLSVDPVVVVVLVDDDAYPPPTPPPLPNLITSNVS